MKRDCFRDGVPFSFERWIPDSARALVVFVHDASDDAQQHKKLLYHLVGHHFAVVAYDQRGFGRSGGRRGHIDDMDTWTSDLEEIVHKSREATGFSLPLFLVGYGLGGLIATHVVTRRELGIVGLIGVAPLFSWCERRPRWKQRVHHFVSRFLPIVSVVPPHQVPGGRLTLRAQSVISDAASRMMPFALKLRLPVLFLQGSEDLLVDKDATKHFFQGVSSREKDFKMMEGADHSLLAGELFSETSHVMMHWMHGVLSEYRKTKPASREGENTWKRNDIFSSAALSS